MMRMKNLERYKIGGTRNRMQLGLPVPQTPDGRVYRYSPNPDAHPRHFVLGNTTDGFLRPTEKMPRMKHVPGSPQTVCPYSGTIAEDAEFTHPDDIKAATALVKHAALADATEAFHGMFAKLARGQRANSIVKFEVGPKPRPRTKPRFRRRDLLRELVCDECGRDYGVFAISLYCPDCGAPNIHLHFIREVELVTKQVDLAEAQKGEQDELAYRLLGNAHEDVLTAFEATLKTVYNDRLKSQPPKTPAPKPVKNDFQNVQRGKERFAEIGYDPFACLSADALSFLTLNIQKRHVIGHNLGIADANFAQHATDARLGETIPLVATDIRRFAEVCLEVVMSLDQWPAGGTPPPSLQRTSLSQVDGPPMPLKEDSEFDGLSPTAVCLGKWITQTSPNGLTHGVQDEAFKNAFNDVPERELAEAIAELEAEGLIQSAGALGLRIPHIRPTNGLFVTFDPVVGGHDPSADAAELIGRILTGGDSVLVEELFKKIEWTHRRFNPALALVIEHVGEGGISGERGGDFPARYFHLAAADRVELKSYLKRFRS